MLGDLPLQDVDTFTYFGRVINKEVGTERQDKNTESKMNIYHSEEYLENR
jgi:hypothetical protein